MLTGSNSSPAAQAVSRSARVLLFDLDETLILDEEATRSALEVVLAPVVGDFGLETEPLAVSLRRHAEQLWRSSPTFDYCFRIGISSSEGLWARFLGVSADMTALRNWAEEYRPLAWAHALREHGITNEPLAKELAEAFFQERRGQQQLFPEALSVLETLRPGRKFGMVTNGASDLQREKIAALGLEPLFDAIVVSGEFGIGKPDPAIFHHILQQLDAKPEEAMMVGDKLERDVAGGLAAGIQAVWINRAEEANHSQFLPNLEVRDLTALADHLTSAT